MFKKVKKILVINAHADDMELGCGATIDKISGKGVEVYNLVLSLNLKGASKKFCRKEIEQEAYRSGKILGLKRENIFIENYENRVFPKYRQEILDTLWLYRKKINPDLVFTGSLDDMHQDHYVVARETFRAFKECNILSYGFDWNRINKYVSFYSVISEENLNKKIEAALSYKSQLLDNRIYFTKEYIRAWAITRGAEIKEKYAEAFEIIRLIC